MYKAFQNSGPRNRPAILILQCHLLPAAISLPPATIPPQPQAPSLTNTTGVQRHGRKCWGRDRGHLQLHDAPPRPRAAAHPSLSISVHCHPSSSSKMPRIQDPLGGFSGMQTVWFYCLKMGTKSPFFSISVGLWEKTFYCLFLSYQFSCLLEAKSL